MSETIHSPSGLMPVDFDPFADAEISAVLPLTEPQREMWTAVQMGDDASCAYNLCYALMLHGPLSEESMQSALQQVVDRHDALRVTIDSNGERQKISASSPIALPLTDISRLSAQSRAEEIVRALQDEATRPFDLATGPLLRARLIREAADLHRLIVAVHHIVCDGWSSAVLFGDLSRIYAADRLGLKARLPAAVAYRDYVAREAARLDEAPARADEDYWVQQYADSVPVLDLPLDRPRPAVKTYRGACRELRLDASLCRTLKTVGAKHGCTLFVTLLAGFEALLSRLSGQDDFTVGAPMAGQALLDNGHLVGHCVNVIPLRCRIAPGTTFADHLKRTRHAFLEAQPHQQFTFGSLVRRLNIPRDPSRTPLVAVTFNIDKIGAPFDFGDLDLDTVEMPPKRFVNFELSINVVDNGRDLLLECEYNTDLFTDATIGRWLSHYRVLLDAIASDPRQRIEDLPLLTEGERHQVISGWNAGRSYPRGACLHERFEQQVRMTPEAVAVLYEGQALCYAELNRRANRLAHRLRALGVVPDQLVGLRVERGIEMVIGILGILKSGGAYLPLDPAYPKQRVAFMLEDSQVGIVVTQQALAADFDGIAVTPLLLEEPLAADDTNPTPVTRADNLAYVIYTSGSTGTPKGALITHYNVARLFEATAHWYHFDSQDVWTLFHSYAFDFSVWELWGALLHGGRVVIVPYWVSRSPEAFRELLIGERVTVLNQTPSAFRQLVQADLAQPPAALALRYVIFGGEALELQTLRPWFERYGDARPQLVNMYGITETTVHVTYRPIRREDLESAQGSVIGIPIPDLQVYLLDAAGAPVPIGVPGEIYVGGAGVARGYLNRPELCAQRFVADPFSTAPGATLYRTGDLARRRDNGDIEYLGRIDSQVKIRGFRIELGEIEAAIARHPAIGQVVVLAREDTPGDKRLVAYLVADNAPADLAEQLRVLLRASMPDYMLPAHFVTLAALPLTENGKLDRKALPPPRTHPIIAPSHTPPRTPSEILVTGLFREVLDCADLGVHDNFFDLGGDSLMAARLMSRLRTASGTDLPLRNLFERPTAAQLAEAIDALSWSAESIVAAAESDNREQIEL